MAAEIIIYVVLERSFSNFINYNIVRLFSSYFVTDFKLLLVTELLASWHFVNISRFFREFL